MLPKKKRVTTKIFLSTLKEGKTFSTRLFLFHYVKNKTPQYAFVAPKKIFKRAIDRNKIRRVGYNILRSMPIVSGIGIFIYKKPSITATNQEIKEDIVFILNKTGLF